MSDALVINGRKLLPIKEVVGRSRYTRDYIAKLAREGLIVGAQIGRQWFVDEESLQKFTEVSELEAVVRRRHLSVERRRERELKQEIERQWDVIPRQMRYSPARAVTATVAIIVIVVLSAFTLNRIPDAVTHIAALQKTQLVPAHNDEPLDNLQVTTEWVVESSQAPESATMFAPIETTEPLATAVLLVPDHSATSAVAITAMFSDPVTVEYMAPGRGQVKGSSSAGTTSIPFVIVPVVAAREGGAEVMPTTP